MSLLMAKNKKWYCIFQNNELNKFAFFMNYPILDILLEQQGMYQDTSILYLILFSIILIFDIINAALELTIYSYRYD